MLIRTLTVKKNNTVLYADDLHRKMGCIFLQSPPACYTLLSHHEDLAEASLSMHKKCDDGQTENMEA